jgi:hypothetical protein
MKKFLLLGVAAMLPMLASASTELVANGSFEADAQANGSWANYANLTGWIGGGLGIELRDNVAGSAQNGVNYVELDTTGNSSMSQNLAGSNSGQFLLTFSYADRIGTGAATNGVQVNFGGTVVNLAGNGDSQNASNHIWHQFSQVFTLTGNDTLTFAALGLSDQLGTSIDNISVTAVPEPETLALMLAGLGMLGVTARRRKISR